MTKFFDIEEVKLAVCNKLTDLIKINFHNDEEKPYQTYNWKPASIGNGGIINWQTEGLQVCYEAEKLLSQEQKSKYVMELDCTNEEACGEYFPNIHSSCEQRLEALCRVWYPERFS